MFYSIYSASIGKYVSLKLIQNQIIVSLQCPVPNHAENVRVAGTQNEASTGWEWETLATKGAIVTSVIVLSCFSVLCATVHSFHTEQTNFNTRLLHCFVGYERR